MVNLGQQRTRARQEVYPGAVTEHFMLFCVLGSLLVSITVGPWLYWRAILRTHSKRRWLLFLTYPLPVAALVALQRYVVGPWVSKNVPPFDEAGSAAIRLVSFTLALLSTFLVPGIVGLLLTRARRSTADEKRVPVEQSVEHVADAQPGFTETSSAAELRMGESDEPNA